MRGRSALMTKREILIDDKSRVEESLIRTQLRPIYDGLRYEDLCLILKTLNDLLEGAINRAKE